MDVRSQIGMVFHLDKCIGCHTCSIACKNIWTDRKGTEYMWWNNVETKPGTGFPTTWEDQEAYKGGWELDEKGKLRLKSTDKTRTVTNIFHNPSMPSMDDYYEPWTYRYQDLFDAPEGTDQPTARPISMVTGEPIEIEGRPELGRRPRRVADLRGERPEPRRALARAAAADAVDRAARLLLPAAHLQPLPEPVVRRRVPERRALQARRGRDRPDRPDALPRLARVRHGLPVQEDLLQLADGQVARSASSASRASSRARRPRASTRASGRIRYLGIVLYDADRLVEVAQKPDAELVDAQREPDPRPERPRGDRGRREAQRDPRLGHRVGAAVARLPVRQGRGGSRCRRTSSTARSRCSSTSRRCCRSCRERREGLQHNLSTSLFHEIDASRVPVAYLANLLGAGNEAPVRAALRKQLAVRLHRRAETVGDVDRETADRALLEAGLTREQADEIFRLTALCTFEDRFVIPPMHREEAIADARGPAGVEAGGGLRLPDRAREGVLTMSCAPCPPATRSTRSPSLLEYPGEGFARPRERRRSTSSPARPPSLAKACAAVAAGGPELEEVLRSDVRLERGALARPRLAPLRRAVRAGRLPREHARAAYGSRASRRASELPDHLTVAPARARADERGRGRRVLRGDPRPGAVEARRGLRARGGEPVPRAARRAARARARGGRGRGAAPSAVAGRRPVRAPRPPTGGLS